MRCCSREPQCCQRFAGKSIAPNSAPEGDMILVVASRTTLPIIDCSLRLIGVHVAHGVGAQIPHHEINPE
jgi:hypothetical protein